MTAEKLDTMVKTMRSYKKIERRIDVLDDIYILYKGLKAIKKDDIARKLIELYEEIDMIDTNEVVKMGTFK